MRYELTMLAYDMNGEPLTYGHGAPLRLRNEVQLGFKQVKWIAGIEFVADFAEIGGGYGGYNAGPRVLRVPAVNLSWLLLAAWCPHNVSPHPTGLTPKTGSERPQIPTQARPTSPNTGQSFRAVRAAGWRSKGAEACRIGRHSAG